MEPVRPPGKSIGGIPRGRQAPRPHSSKQRCAMAAGAPLRPGADAGAAPDCQEDRERRPRDSFICARSPLLITTGESIPLRGSEGVPGLPGAPQDEAGLIFLASLGRGCKLGSFVGFFGVYWALNH